MDTTNPEISEPSPKKLKKDKKAKKRSKDEVEAEEASTNDSATKEKVVISFEDQLKNINAIAKPMVNKKLAKRVYKSIAEAKGEKKGLRRGLKEVTKALKKKEKGFVVFAGDVIFWVGFLVGAHCSSYDFYDSWTASDPTSKKIHLYWRTTLL